MQKSQKKKFSIESVMLSTANLNQQLRQRRVLANQLGLEFKGSKYTEDNVLFRDKRVNNPR